MVDQLFVDVDPSDVDVRPQLLDEFGQGAGALNSLVGGSMGVGAVEPLGPVARCRLERRLAEQAAAGSHQRHHGRRRWKR